MLVERERPTDVGPIDLCCRDAEGRVTLVEVKRVRAVASAVEQVVRYREQAERDPSIGPVRALVVAPEFAPQARVLADARGVDRVTLDVGRLVAEAEEELRSSPTGRSAGRHSRSRHDRLDIPPGAA